MGCGANREETERTKCPIVAKPARMGHPSVTGLWLACIIVAIVVVAPSRFSISKPYIQVAKLCVLRFAKDIFVGKNPPSVQTFPPFLAALNPFHFGIVDRKSTRLNSSHQIISNAVFCLKNKRIVNFSLTMYFCVASKIVHVLL